MTVRVDCRGDDGLPDGLATMSARTLRAHDLASGDHVRVETGSGAHGVVQVIAHDGADEALAIDARLERLLGVSVGEDVTVQPIDVVSADRVTLSLAAPLDTVDNLSLYVRDRLIGQALLEGQRLRLERDPEETTDARTEDVVAEVTATAPQPSVVVRDWTSIRVRTGVQEVSVADGRATRESSSVTRADVGGLDAELAELDELVHLALHDPARCVQFGVDPPRCILLAGPSGTGKTLLARAAATHAEASLERLSGPSLASLSPDEVDARLDDAFAPSNDDPAVVLLEDIDALTTERRSDEPVVRLLARVDALAPRSRTVVVATTTRPDEVPTALRRPGRFDHELSVGAPNRDAREEILAVHTRSIPFAADVDLGAYAERTHGFVGADLVSLVRESLLRALRQRGSETAATTGSDPFAALDEAETDIRVTDADLERGLRATDPSALRELLTEVPDVSWADVGGLDEVKDRLRESVQWPLEHAAAFEQVALRPPTGILLYGPSGTGKTLLARAVANEADSNFISVKGPELVDKYVGESERGVRDVFAKARENAPTVVYFDEIDAIASERGEGSGDGGVTERIVSQLLTELDGLEDLKDVIVVATTNRPGLVDDALLRPGRFDRHVHVGVPDEAARREIFAIHTDDRPLADDVDLDTLAAETDGYVGADIEAVCREAATAAVREYVAGGTEDLEGMALTREHFEQALAETESSTTGDAAGFERFRERVGERER